MDSLDPTKERKMDMRFGIWNVRVPLQGSFTENNCRRMGIKYNLHLVTVQEVRCVEGGSQQADVYVFFCHQLEARFFVHKW